MRSIFFERPDPLALRLRTRGEGQVWVWLPVAIAVGVIVAESTDLFSASHTSSWLRPLAERWLGPVSDRAWEMAHHLLRKAGHFCGYGAVCLTFLRAWLLTFGGITDLAKTSWRWRSVVAAVVCTAVVASCDEIHQSFIPSRTGTVRDVLLDSCGAGFSCALVWIFFWRRRRGRGPRQQEVRQVGAG